MKAIKFFILASFLVSGLTVKAQSVAESLLTRDLLTSAKTLTSEKRIYNYFSLSGVGGELETAEGRHNFVNRYLSSSAGNFWRDDFTNTSPSMYADGPGLYFAIDPLISQQYGNSFIEVVMPVGTRFINVVHPIPLKKDTIAALMTEGLVNQTQMALLFPKQNGFYRDTLRMMVDPQFSEFKKMVRRIFSANQIQFVEYNFNSSLGRFCTTHSYSAFTYVGEQNPLDATRALVPVALQNTMVFSTVLDIPNLTAEEQERKDAIVKFRSTLQQIQGQSTVSAKKIISGLYSQTEYLSVRDSAYSCQ